MNKRGVTLIELLGALVIFGLIISLVASVISLINYASDKIELNSAANSQGLFLDREIKDDLLEFGPTEYITCGTNCVTFQKDFMYEFDAELGDIVLTTYVPALTHKIEINNNQIFINDVAINTGIFTIGSGSSIELVENLTQLYFILTVELVAENGKIFTFTTSYSFTMQVIPAS